MRLLAWLAVSFGIGAWAFSGQEEGEQELRRRVRELTAELARRADARFAATAESAPVLQIHDFASRSLAREVGERSRELDLAGSWGAPEPVEWEVEPTFGIRADDAIALIRECIEPKSWVRFEEVEIAWADRGLRVRHVPRVQRRVALLLHRLARLRDRAVQVEVRAVRLSQERFPQTAEEWATLLSTEPLGSLLVRCPAGGLVHRRAGRTIHYLGDYDVEIAGEISIGEPEPEGVFEGCAASVRALLDEGAGGVRLELELDRNRLARPIRRVDTEHGPLELPSLGVTRLRTAFWTPLGRWTVAGGSRACLFVVRAERSRHP